MWRRHWMRAALPMNAGNSASPATLRDQLARWLALVTLACLAAAFFFSKSTQFLMPGALSSAHGSIEKCNACHTKSGDGKVSWPKGLVAGDPRADSKACMTCHTMPETAYNPHGASTDRLRQSTERLSRIAAEANVPRSASAQHNAFPTKSMVANGLTCATCHQEHQGSNFKLGKITNEQCRSCHVVKFDSFDGAHPSFENYPFKKRTSIIYDHAGHFDKHYPDVAKKDPNKRIPATCSTCHNSADDKRIMSVAPFDKTCATCHLDQITGKDRVSGPKGIAFLSLPGIDLASLKSKNVSTGEWPDASDAALTPFMKVMIGRTEQGRALLKTLDGLNLLDLSAASDQQLQAVSGLVWETKAMIHALIAGKASDVLGDLNIGGGAKLSATLVADLTASIPRDVLIAAQQEWLPNLATEISNRSGAGETALNARVSVTPASDPTTSQTHTPSSAGVSPMADDRGAEPEAVPEAATNASDANEPADAPSDDRASDVASPPKRDPLPCVVRVFGQCLVSKEPGNIAQAPKPNRASDEKPAANLNADDRKPTATSEEIPPPMRLGLADTARVAGPQNSTRSSEDLANTRRAGGEGPPLEGTREIKTAENAGDKADDLLFPSEAELREMKNLQKDAGPTTDTSGAPNQSGTANAPSHPSANTEASAAATKAPAITIQSDVDPESWAEYGGWYRQDHAIFYRPAGHKDKFVFAWLFLTGPQAPKNSASPSAAVFEALTSKDAQGGCTKCHSIDELQGKQRVVNFAPLSPASKLGRFTTFIHEPHFSINKDRGCLTCHGVEKGRPYLKSYEHGDPHKFASNFSAMKKDLCQSCHTATKARQDCLTCHKYHVNGVVSPLMTTKLPTP